MSALGERLDKLEAERQSRRQDATSPDVVNALGERLDKLERSLGDDLKAQVDRQTKRQDAADKATAELGPKLEHLEQREIASLRDRLEHLQVDIGGLEDKVEEIQERQPQPSRGVGTADHDGPSTKEFTKLQERVEELSSRVE